MDSHSNLCNDPHNNLSDPSEGVIKLEETPKAKEQSSSQSVQEPPAYSDSTPTQHQEQPPQPNADISMISAIMATTIDRRRELDNKIRVCDEIATLLARDFSPQSCIAFVRYQTAAIFELLDLITDNLSALSTLEVVGLEAVKFGDAKVAELEVAKYKWIGSVEKLISTMNRCGLQELATELDLRLESWKSPTSSQAGEESLEKGTTCETGGRNDTSAE